MLPKFSPGEADATSGVFVVSMEVGGIPLGEML
jgi:hypothetical protein